MSNRDNLIIENLHLVDSVVARFNGDDTGINTREDLYQEGCIGLINAVERGDPENPYFKAYIKTSIWNSIMQKIEKTKKFTEYEILPSSEYNDNGDDVTTGVPSEELLKVEPNAASIYNNGLIGYLTMRAADAGLMVHKGIKYLILYVNGYSQNEIAKIYKESDKNAVSSYISIAKKYFRNDEEFNLLFG